MANISNDEPLTYWEELAVSEGEDLIAYREKEKLMTRISDESQKYIGTPVSNWPKIQFNWDLSNESQCYTLDAVSKNNFTESHPDGFLLGYVNLKDIDSILCEFSRRDDGELWDVGCEHKLAKLIVYLSEGRPISPPLVKPIDGGEVIFQGGHHRYAIAKVVGVQQVPIHVDHQYKKQVQELLTVNWAVT